jgi:hypothetical protein
MTILLFVGAENTDKKLHKQQNMLKQSQKPHAYLSQHNSVGIE